MRIVRKSVAKITCGFAVYSENQEFKALDVFAVRTALAIWQNFCTMQSQRYC